MYVLIGAAAGLAIDDLLNATGLHWLTWPVVSLLAGAAIGITVAQRRARKRS